MRYVLMLKVSGKRQGPSTVFVDAHVQYRFLLRSVAPPSKQRGGGGFGRSPGGGGGLLWIPPKVGKFSKMPYILYFGPLFSGSFPYIVTYLPPPPPEGFPELSAVENCSSSSSSDSGPRSLSPSKQNCSCIHIHVSDSSHHDFVTILWEP